MKELEKHYPERKVELENIASSIFKWITEKYKISAQDFLVILETTKEHGLKQFKL